MHCILISMWFVRCKSCRVHCLTLTSTHKWTPLFSHRETPWNTAWQQQNKDWLSFQSSRKCNSKFDCLVYEMLYIKDMKPSLNTQVDSIRAELFTWLFRTFFFSRIVFLTLGIIPIGPANILCIVSNLIYSFYTLYFFTFQLDNGVTYRRSVVHFFKCFLNVF